MINLSFANRMARLAQCSIWRAFTIDIRTGFADYTKPGRDEKLERIMSMHYWCIARKEGIIIE